MNDVPSPHKPRLVQSCVCCGHSEPVDAPFRNPLCRACALPGQFRSYCTGCGRRGEYEQRDFQLLMQKHFPDADCEPGTVIELPKCAACLPEGRDLEEGSRVVFHQLVRN